MIKSISIWHYMDGKYVLITQVDRDGSVEYYTDEKKEEFQQSNILMTSIHAEMEVKS